MEKWPIKIQTRRKTPSNALERYKTNANEASERNRFFVVISIARKVA